MAPKARSLAKLAIAAFVFMGWQLFSDGPLAYYILAGLLIGLLAIESAITRPGKEWAAYAYCAFSGLTASACGGLYSASADGFHYLCDRGTGLPVSSLSGLVAIAAAVYIYTDGGRDG